MQPVAESLIGVITFPPVQKFGAGGESVGHVLSPGTHVKPMVQPDAFFFAVIVPPLQKPGAGGESAGQPALISEERASSSAPSSLDATVQAGSTIPRTMAQERRRDFMT
jgi:hypothetical protein